MQTNILDSNDLIGQWKREIRLAHISQQIAATESDKPHAALRSAGVVMSLIAVSGTVAYFGLDAYFASHSALKLSVAGAYVGAAAVASWLSVRRHADLARRYRQGVVRFGELRKEIEEYSASRTSWKEFAEGFQARWNALASDVPAVAKKVQAEAAKQVETIKDEARPASSQHVVIPPMEHLRELVRKYKARCEPETASEGFNTAPAIRISEPEPETVANLEVQEEAAPAITIPLTMEAPAEAAEVPVAVAASEELPKLDQEWQLHDVQQADATAEEVVPVAAESTALDSLDSIESRFDAQNEFAAVAAEWQREAIVEVAVAEAPIASESLNHLLDSLESRWDAPVEEAALVVNTVETAEPEVVPVPELAPVVSSVRLDQTNFRCIRRRISAE